MGNDRELAWASEITFLYIWIGIKSKPILNKNILHKKFEFHWPSLPLASSLVCDVPFNQGLSQPCRMSMRREGCVAQNRCWSMLLKGWSQYTTFLDISMTVKIVHWYGCVTRSTFLTILAYGVTTNGVTTFVNAAVAGRREEIGNDVAQNRPFVFDLQRWLQSKTSKTSSILCTQLRSIIAL